MDIDYNLIIAITAVAGTIISIWAIIIESKSSRLLHSSDMILNLFESFNNDEMRRARKASATYLLSSMDNPNTDEQPNTDVEKVLDFFQLIGLLTRRGALDKQMVWSKFFYYLHPYHYAAEKYITTRRNIHEDISLWADINKLHKRLISIEKHERQCPITKISLDKDSIKKYLEEEILL